jgi:Protein of unknown function (DUF4031)
MIVFDRPRPVAFHHFRRTAHLISTLEAPWSTEEILTFGARIGLRSEWLQHPGHWKEHFDLFDEGILRARDAGALEVARRRMAEMNERRLRHLRTLREIAA